METTRFDVLKVAEDTYAIAALIKRPNPLPGYIYFNSFVILGREPVLIDTHTVAHRAEYLKAVWSIVEPKDVRWIYLTHDDRDHAGNLMQVLAACTKARLVTNAIGVARLNEEYDFRMSRVNFLNHGETLTVHDRTLVAVRPPLFDSPATNAIYDPKSGVLFAADSFGAYVPAPAEEVGDIPAQDYAQGFYTLNRTFFPWFELIDPAKFEKFVGAIRVLQPRTIVGCHGPAARNRTDQMLKLMLDITTLPRVPMPTQHDLERMLALAGTPKPPAK